MLWPISVIWGVQLRASVLAIRALGRHCIELFLKNSQKPAVSYPFPDPMYVAFFKQGFMVDVREGGSVIFKSSWTMPSRDRAERITFQVRSRVDCATACINENACSGYDTDSPGYFILCHMAMGSVPHDDVIKWKHFPRYWPFVRGIHRSPVNSPHKGQWRGSLMFSLICVWINDWVNNREAGGLRRCRAHYDVTVMKTSCHTVT